MRQSISCSRHGAAGAVTVNAYFSIELTWKRYITFDWRRSGERWNGFVALRRRHVHRFAGNRATLLRTNGVRHVAHRLIHAAPLRRNLRIDRNRSRVKMGHLVESVTSSARFGGNSPADFLGMELECFAADSGVLGSIAGPARASPLPAALVCVGSTVAAPADTGG